MEPRYRTLMNDNTNNGITLIIELQQSLTQKQRNHLDKKLVKWITIFNELAEELSTT